MARVVILSFADNDAAERFIDLTLSVQGSDRNWHEFSEIGAIVGSMSKVEALVARPTMSCPCRSVRKGDSHKSPRFGWWVHNPCNKPQKEIVRNFIKNLYVGYNNLLPEIVAKRAKQVGNEQTFTYPNEYGPELVDSGTITGRLTSDHPHYKEVDRSTPALSEPEETWKVPSSRPGKTHTVERRGDSFSCSCEDYMYRKAATGEACKHIAPYKQVWLAQQLAEAVSAGDVEIDPDSSTGQVLAALGHPIEKGQDEQ